MSRVLVIGDLHLPAHRTDYLKFCKDLRRKYRTDETIYIGDVVDHHALSFYNKHPEAEAAQQEYEKSMEGLREWKKAFPSARVCIGNHDERIHRSAAASGIPSMYLKSYTDIFDTPNYEWEYEFEVDGVYYTHGTGLSGLCPAFNMAKALMQSVVCGHIHSVGAIMHGQGPGKHKIFGFNVPCGVDRDHALMYYGRNFLKKPVNGAGVVINGKPYMETMD